MNTKPFSVRRALDNDFNLTAPLLVPLIFWAVTLLSLMLLGGSQILLILAVIVTLGSPILIFLRLRTLRDFFESGERIIGELTRVYFFQDRGRIDYTYTYAGNKYSGSAAIHKNDLTRELVAGQAVPLVVDRDHPARSLMADLFS
jgi:hypothetical protein